MPDEKSQPEPSMEEIIASISRLIAEDKRPGDKRPADQRPGDQPPGDQRPGDRRPGDSRAADARTDGTSLAPPGEESDILELTQAINRDGSVRRITPRAAAVAAPPPPAAATGSAAADRAARIEARVDGAMEPRLEGSRERIVSAAASGAAAAAFAQLGALPRDRRREGGAPLGGVERTLEEIVRDMLRPMLQGWLDEHLPAIVERLVRDEIARVVGEAGLR